MVEKPTEIRTRRQRGRRRRHHSLSYAQLRGFIGDKAEAAGAISVAIEPRHTSRRWTRCGHVRRRNLPTQSTFGRGRADTRLAPTSTRAQCGVKVSCRGGMPAAGGLSVNGLSWECNARISLLTSHRFQLEPVVPGPERSAGKLLSRASLRNYFGDAPSVLSPANSRSNSPPQKEAARARDCSKPVAAQSIPQFSPPIPLQVMPGRCDGETVGRPRESACPAQAFH